MALLTSEKAVRMFPILHGKVTLNLSILETGHVATLRSIPWDLIEPHRKQAWKNHGQTLERLAERGGLDPLEAIQVLEDKEWGTEWDKQEAISRIVDLCIRKGFGNPLSSR